MTNPVILVTAAAGKTGSAVVQQLRALGYGVRAIVRREDARSKRLAQTGAEIVVADLFDAGQMLDAMRGVARAYYCPPIHARMLQSAVAFAVAAKQARLEGVVVLTQWLASAAHPSIITRQHWLADQMFAWLPGVACTTVAQGFFASLPFLEVLDYAALLGVYPMPVAGESRNAPPSDEDIARVVVAALIDPARHAGKTYRPTGPEMLSVREMTAIMGRVTGRTVRHVRLPEWMFLKAARMGGLDPILLCQMPAYMRDQSAGAFELGGVTDHVLAVTGRAPEDFETITRRYAALPKARRTFGNAVRALAAFASVPFRPGHDPVRYAREQGFPVPAAALQAMANAAWREDRRSVALPAALPVRLFASA